MNLHDCELAQEYDYVVIGSGFGGSVSALRLSEKGYKVLVIEKGKWYRPEDFAKTSWQLNRWLWIPQIKLTGIMRVTLLRHITILSGVGVGGGSLVYACTLPVPKPPFFQTGSWASLNDWENALKPHYDTAYQMLGAGINPKLCSADFAMQRVAQKMGKAEDFTPTKVGIFFAKEGQTPGQSVPDPFFDGAGPDRTPCTHCGQCMTGCPTNAKNSLDKNYLYFAQKNGAQILAQTFVHDIKPLGEHGQDGYEIHVRDAISWLPKKRVIRARGIVFSGGALGTVKLLLALKKKGSLPHLSNRVGHDVRTNSESLIAVTTAKKDVDLSQGIAIGSIFHPDEHSHIEPTRYGPGSGTWRLLFVPVATGRNFVVRVARMFGKVLRHPITYLRLVSVSDWARQSQFMLFMQHLDSTLRFSLGATGHLKTQLGVGEPPKAFIPEAVELAERYADEVGGKTFTIFSEQISGIPATAHILGGAVMGADASSGVVDAHGRVYGYEHAFVCDGSVVSANPGVNPSLSITAISEYIMSQIPHKQND